MPTYEYECTGCGLVFEEEKAITAPARQRCPKCRHKVKQLISGGVGIMFKGTGFYVNDSRGKSQPPASESTPEPAAAKPATDKPKTTATKPAAD